MENSKKLEVALKRYDKCVEFESQERKNYQEDGRFAEGHQWDDEMLLEREESSRPCLTINRIPQFLRQVQNEQRQNRHGVAVSGVDSVSDPKVAEVIQGTIRHIETNSDAEVAYDTASEHQVKLGIGWIRVLTDFVDDDSFDQEILIERISNPLTVYVDPSANGAVLQDMRYAFITEEISKEEFKELYPNVSLDGLEEWKDNGANNQFLWVTEEKIRIAEYFQIVTKPRRLIVRNGVTAWYDEIAGPDLSAEERKIIDSEIERERMVPIRRVEWCKMVANQILEEKDWPGRWIPLIPVIGDESYLEGRRKFWGMVRNGKDPQRAYNYWTSCKTELIALAPKAPFIGPEGSFVGYEADWQKANQAAFGYLQYKPVVDAMGNALPAPARQPFEPPVQAIGTAVAQAADDLKSTMGLYGASLGDVGPEQSGEAIKQRQSEGDTGTFNYIDNLHRSLRHVGRILVDLIPHIYDIPRLARIIGEDQAEKKVDLVNDPSAPAVESVEQEDGSFKEVFNIGVGRYDVTVSAGPSFATKRQAAMDAMTKFMSTNPNAMAWAGDILFDNSDWPGAAEMAKRARKMLPPGLLEDDDENKPSAPPPEVQQQLNNLQQQLQQAQAQNQQLQSLVQGKQMELQSRQEIETMKIQSQQQLEAQRIKSREDMELMKVRVDIIKTQERLESAEEIATLKAELARLGDIVEERALGGTV